MHLSWFKIYSVSANTKIRVFFEIAKLISIISILLLIWYIFCYLIVGKYLDFIKFKIRIIVSAIINWLSSFGLELIYSKRSMVKPVIFFCKFLKNQYSLRGFLMKLVKFSFLLTFDSCLQVSHCLLLINFLFEKKSLGNNWMLATVFEKDTHDHITLKGQCRFHMLHHPLLVIPENLWFSCVHFRVKNDIF